MARLRPERTSKEVLSAKQNELVKAMYCNRVTIASGPVASAKTAGGLYGFMTWATHNYQDQDFAVAVRTDKQFTNPILAEIHKWFGPKFLKRRGTHWDFGNGNKLHRVIGNNIGAAEKVQGMNLAGAFIDEFPKQPEEFIQVLHGRCRIPGAKIVMTCNPEGPLHWAKTEWIDKRKEQDFAVLFFEMDDNPVLDQEYKEAIKKQYTGVMRQRLIYGKWAAATGMVYPMFHRAEGEMPRNRRVASYNVAMDVASASVTHALLIATDTTGVRWILDEWRHDGNVDGQMEEREQARQMLLQWNGVNIASWIIDPAANNMQVILQQMGQVTQHGYNDVIEGIQTVNMWINDGRLKYSSRCVALKREGGSYQWDERSADKNIDRPIKGNDHGMDAMRYGVNTMARHRPAVRRTQLRRAS